MSFERYYTLFTQQRDKSPESTEIRRISVDLYANPSLFTVYAAVRQTVLEQCMNEATHIYHQSISPTTDSDSDEDGEEKSKELAIKLPKVWTTVPPLIFQHHLFSAEKMIAVV